MSENSSVQVLLVTAGRPVRILAERDLADTGSVVVAFNADRAPADIVIGQGFEHIALDGAPLADAESPLRVARGVRGEAEVVAVGSDTRYPYLTRPLRPEEVRRMLAPAAGAVAAEAPAALLRLSMAGGPIFGASPAMARIGVTLERVAPSSTTVLLCGETGTGKTLLARAVHQLSPRRDRPFVAVNCGAFQETLLESELFGHERGAFTGAVADKAGLFEVAHQGTLFLDEVAELSRSMQAKLLQVLDSGEFRRVGGTRLRKADVRIVAATNRDLEHEVKDGRFREDLFFRLSVLAIPVPALRDRREDLPALIAGLLERLAGRGLPAKAIAADAVAALASYRWPGNVRELSNILEGLLLLSPEPVIGIEQLPRHIRAASPAGGSVLPADSASAVPQIPSSPPMPLVELERQHVQAALAYTTGNKAAAARLLGIDVKTLNSKVKAP